GIGDRLRPENKEEIFLAGTFLGRFCGCRSNLHADTAYMQVVLIQPAGRTKLLFFRFLCFFRWTVSFLRAARPDISSEPRPKPTLSGLSRPRREGKGGRGGGCACCVPGLSR
ncbi:unnamed protein product, partial [Laminaria digitata]